MIVAVLSDIHDCIDHLEWAKNEIKVRQVELLICCGDFSRPETLEMMADWGLPLHFCLGNTDQSETQAFRSLAGRKSNLHFGGRMGRLALVEGDVLFTHYPEQALQAANSSGAIAVFFGHSHRRHVEIIAGDENRPDCLLANPGDIQNRFDDGPGFLIWDSTGKEHKFVIRE